MNEKIDHGEKKVLRIDGMSPPEVESWMRHAWEMKQKAPGRIEDAAKFLATMNSICLTLFLGMQKLDPGLFQSWLAKAAMIGWLGSLMASFWVLYQKRYDFNPDSAESIKSMNEKIIGYKSRRLFFGVVLFLIGFLPLLYMAFK